MADYSTSKTNSISSKNLRIKRKYWGSQSKGGKERNEEEIWRLEEDCTVTTFHH